MSVNSYRRPASGGTTAGSIVGVKRLVGAIAFMAAPESLPLYVPLRQRLTQLPRLAIVSEGEVPSGYRLVVQLGASQVPIIVYVTNIQVQGKESDLKTRLQQIKAEVERGDPLPQNQLPCDVERLPEQLQAQVPGLDEVVLRLFVESVNCCRADLLLSSAFMIGAASEWAVNLLVETFCERIIDDGEREKFSKKTTRKPISVRFEEFLKAYKNCTNKPVLPNIETRLEQTFEFHRLLRNEIGHPQSIPDLTRNSRIRELEHFIYYMSHVGQII